jgi:acylphosphatase
MKTRVKVSVSGRVQGVFFRAFTKESALRHDVSGWVRNLPKGGVEAILEGDDERVKQVLNDLNRGPPYSRVENVDILIEDYNGEFTSFEIRY